MPDQTFESKFGQLVDNSLMEKIPSLIPFRVGFQLIDKNEEETQAVGVCAFIVNDLWLYVPIFFLEGKLKGMDLLYVKQSNMFVPARDNWFSVLKNKGADILGDVEQHISKPLKDDVMADRSNIPRISPTGTGDVEVISYGGKQASEQTGPSDRLIDPDTLDKMLKTGKKFGFDFCEKLASLGPDAGLTFVNTMTNDVSFANSVFMYYKPEELQKIAGRVAEAYRKQTEVKPSKVTFITDYTSKEAQTLQDNEKKILVQQGLFIKDDRSEHTKVFNPDIKSMVVQNPNFTGPYDLLLADGSFKPVLVVKLNDSVLEEKHCHRFTRGQDVKVAVVDLEKPTYYSLKSVKDVYCKQMDIDVSQPLENKKGGLDATRQNCIQIVTDADKSNYGATRVNSNVVHFANVLFTQGTKRTLLCRIKIDKNGELSAEGPDYTPIAIEFTDKEGKLGLYGTKVFIPTGVRLFVEAPYSETPLVCGDLATLHRMLIKEADLKPLQLRIVGPDFYYKTAGMNKWASGSKVTALTYLINNCGIFAGQAQQMLKEASSKKDKTATFLLKLAAYYDYDYYGESKAPDVLGKTGPKTENAVTITKTIVGGKKLLPMQVIEQANRAAQTGIKEVFDVTVLSNLINIADISDIRKDYIADVVKGMDKVGRMMFIMYWHNDAFKDKYGEEELMNLEDSLKQVFLKLGDLVIFLKEKTAFAPDTSESMLGDLSEDLGSIQESNQNA